MRRPIPDGRGRLPTAIEWERAARGDQQGARSLESRIASPKGIALANSRQGVFPIRDTAHDGHAGLAPIGSHPPNGFGLHDMIGNVREWASTDHGEGRRPLEDGSFPCARNCCADDRPAAWRVPEHGPGASRIGFRIVS